MLGSVDREGISFSNIVVMGGKILVRIKVVFLGFYLYVKIVCSVKILLNFF